MQSDYIIIQDMHQVPGGGGPARAYILYRKKKVLLEPLSTPTPLLFSWIWRPTTLTSLVHPSPPAHCVTNTIDETGHDFL